MLELERGRGTHDQGQLLPLAAGAGRAAGGAGRPVRAPAAGAGPPSAVRRPLPLRHQVAPGAEQAEGDGADRAGRPARASSASLRFDFPPPARSGRVVLEAEGVCGGRWPAASWCTTPRSAIERGQRVALIGRNGAGKTTLLETLLGRREPAEHGRVRSWATGSTLAYYSQQSLELPEQARLVDDVAHGTKLTGPQARTLLGRFLFSRRPGREAGQRALGRRAAAARAGPARGLGRQLPGARRAHQPPRHREPRGARGRARQLPRHDPVRVPRPRPDRGPGDAHHRHRGPAAATARRRLRRVRPRPRAGRRQAVGRRQAAAEAEAAAAGQPAKAAAPKPARSGRSGARPPGLESQIERLEEELGAVSSAALPARRLPGSHRRWPRTVTATSSSRRSWHTCIASGSGGWAEALTICKTGCRIGHGPQCATPSYAIDAPPPGAASGADADDDARTGGAAGPAHGRVGGGLPQRRLRGGRRRAAPVPGGGRRHLP